ncbi:MAG: hypothetical protein AAB116_16920 [Candidatus Poribacteria bacterium]
MFTRMHNKSLHPIRPCVPAFAWFSGGAANAGPPVRTGELNRYEEHLVKYIPAILLPLLFVIGCSDNKINIVVTNGSTVSMSNIPAEADWVEFTANYYYCMTNPKIYPSCTPDIYGNGHFILVGNIHAQKQIVAIYEPYSKEMIGVLPPKNNPEGIIQGTIRNITYGAGNPPSYYTFPDKHFVFTAK